MNINEAASADFEEGARNSSLQFVPEPAHTDPRYQSHGRHAAAGSPCWACRLQRIRLSSASAIRSTSIYHGTAVARNCTASRSSPPPRARTRAPRAFAAGSAITTCPPQVIQAAQNSVLQSASGSCPPEYVNTALVAKPPPATFEPCGRRCAARWGALPAVQLLV